MDRSLHYYDLVLVCIVGSLAAGIVVGYATAVPFEVAISILGILAIAFIVHALFINGPIDEVDELTEEVPIEEVPNVLSPLEETPRLE